MFTEPLVGSQAPWRVQPEEQGFFLGGSGTWLGRSLPLPAHSSLFLFVYLHLPHKKWIECDNVIMYVKCHVMTGSVSVSFYYQHSYHCYCLISIACQAKNGNNATDWWKDCRRAGNHRDGVTSPLTLQVGLARPWGMQRQTERGFPRRVLDVPRTQASYHGLRLSQWDGVVWRSFLKWVVFRMSFGIRVGMSPAGEKRREGAECHLAPTEGGATGGEGPGQWEG